MTDEQPKPRYARILLKLSGEALMGNGDYGIDREMVQRIAGEISDVHAMGAEISVVVGGGNIFRGVSAASRGMERAAADYMGMLATVINALSLQNALESAGVAKLGCSRRLPCRACASPISGAALSGTWKRVAWLSLRPEPETRSSVPTLPLPCALRR